MMRRSPRGAVPVLAVALLVLAATTSIAGAAYVGTASAGVLTGAGGATTVTGAVDSPTLQSGTFDRTTVTITVYSNASARWTFEYARPLENESEREDFETYADRFNSEETALYRSFVNDSEALVSEGANVTGRDMEARDFDRQAEVRTNLDTDLGVVRMSFTWSAFAEDRDDRVVVADVFEGGLYLGPEQSLVVRPGPGLVFDEVRPPGTQSDTSSLRDSDSVTWQGERQFTDNRPFVALVPESAAPEETSPATTTGAIGQQDDGRTGWLPAFLGGATIVAGLVVAAWWTRRDEDSSPGSPTHPSGGPGGDGAGASPSGAGDPAERGATESTGDSPERAAGLSDAELLSNEGRVISLLEAHDGRMKQSRIVEETNWSKSKVSMLLSEMSDEGRVEKLRLGRENVISLVDGEESKES